MKSFYTDFKFTKMIRVHLSKLKTQFAHFCKNMDKLAYLNLMK